jgi:hypothetical protein
MAHVTESATYEAGIYQLETTDPVEGGANGVSNVQARQLASRTKWLKERVDALVPALAFPVVANGYFKLAEGALELLAGVGFHEEYPISNLGSGLYSFRLAGDTVEGYMDRLIIVATVSGLGDYRRVYVSEYSMRADVGRVFGLELSVPASHAGGNADSGAIAGTPANGPPSDDSGKVRLSVIVMMGGEVD